MNLLLKHNWKFTVVGILLVILCGVFRAQFQTDDTLKEEQFESFKSALYDEEVLLRNELETCIQTIEDDGYKKYLIDNQEHFKLLEEQGIGLYVYEGSDLKFWSTNSFPLIEYNQLKSGFVRLTNGWYDIFYIKKKDFLFVGQLQIKKEYRYTNSYINNSFNKSILNYDGWLIGECNDNTGFKFKTDFGKDELCLVPNVDSLVPTSFLVLVLEWLGVLLIPIGLIIFVYVNPNWASFVISTLIILGFRGALLIFEAPINLHEIELFSPLLYASSDLIPSLGDLLLHTYYLFSIVVLGYFYTPRVSKIQTNYLLNIVFSVSVIALIFYVATNIELTIKSLVIDSKISLDLSEVLNIDKFSFIAFLSLGFIVLAFYLFLNRLIYFIQKLGTLFNVFAGSIIVITLIFIAIISWKDLSLTLLWPAPILLILAYVYWFNQGQLKFSSSIFIVLVTSLFVTYTLEEALHEKEVTQKLKLLSKQAEEKDPITHYLFSELRKEIQNDSVLYSSLNTRGIGEEELYNYLKNNYFNKYWEKYNLKITSCFAQINDDQKYVYTNDCEDNFVDFIDNKTKRVQHGLYFYKTDENQSNYIGVIQFSEFKKLYIELDSKFKPEGLGFPVLLVNQQVENNSLNNRYSFAKYVNNELVLKKGTYSYSHNPSHFSVDTAKDYTIINYEEHEHLIIKSGNQTYVISEQSFGSWGQMASYSYFFAFFSVIAIILYAITRIASGEKVFELNLKSRFQLSIISILLFSLIFIGWGSVYYIQNKFNEKNFETIVEKIKSVSIEVEHKLGGKTNLDGVDKEYTQYILNKFSNVFFTDINLYNPNGRLIASSQPKIFKEGLVDDHMDANAFYQLSQMEKSMFVQIEDIENMAYLSAYVPFRNDKNELLAYLNLPYFARSSDLKTEISDFIVALINIYVLLVVIALVFALFITNRITLPLRLIQEKMSRIKLGASNEFIEWSSKDEIGKLISEYNRMVVELVESANSLAQSEREGAWREMAQQVAHEIKNPLTPIKLSIQHLQMRWDSMTKDQQDEKFKDFANNLIHQIDTLSSIATEFSSFAKMPDTVLVETDIIKTINSSIGVYDGTSGVKIKLKTGVDHAFVLSDKDQLIRVFNNLIKNAIQAIPDDRQGFIDIEIYEEDDHLVIKVKDNGKGISDADRHKIFVPNFTTKSSGMGLGLAMVQKIIENSSGKIRFESEVNVGTTFIIELPIIKN